MKVRLGSCVMAEHGCLGTHTYVKVAKLQDPLKFHLVKICKRLYTIVGCHF